MRSFKAPLFFGWLLLLGIGAPVFGESLPSYVETRMGKFPLGIPALVLPELQPLKLTPPADPAFPELPLWHLDPQLRPPKPGWLDRGGEKVEKAFMRLVSIQSENEHEKRKSLDQAVREFSTVASEYPDTLWRVPATFWGSYAQLQIARSEAAERVQSGNGNQRKLCKQSKSLRSVQQNLKHLLEDESISQFRPQAVVMLVWHPLFERCYAQAIQENDQYKQLVRKRSKEHEKLLEFATYSYLKQGKYDKAIVQLRQLQMLFPQQRFYTEQIANLHYLSGQWEALEQLGRRMAKRDINHAATQKILELVLRSHLQRKQWDQAHAILKQLEGRGAVGDLKFLGYGEIALQQNNLKLAFRSVQAIRDHDLKAKMWKRLIRKAAMEANYKLLLDFNKEGTLPPDSEHHLIQGYALYQTRDHLQAYGALQPALATSQGGNEWIWEQALFLRSTIELRSRDFKKADRHLQELLSKFEESNRRSEYYYWLGVLQLEQRKPLRGVQLGMRQVRPDGPRGDGRWYVLGFSSHEAKEWGKAVLFFKRLIDQHPQSPFREEGYYRLADSYYQQEKHSEAGRVFSEYRKEFQVLSKPVRVIERQVQNLMKLGKLEEAHSLLLKEVPLHPDFRLVALHLEILSERKDNPGMLELTSRARSYRFSDDQRGLLAYHRANALFRAKRFEESLSRYLEAQQNPPKNLLRFIKYRIIHTQHILKNYPQFVKLSEDFVQENQNDKKENDVLVWLSDHYENTGNRDQAKPHWKQLTLNYQSTAKVEPLPKKRLGLIIRIGGLHNKLANYKEAERWVDQGLILNEKVGGERQRDQALKLLLEKGIAAYGMGQHKRALAASLKVSYLNRSMSEREAYQLHLRIADSYQQLGRVREAKAIYLKLLQRLQDTQRRELVQRKLQTLENG